MARICVVRQFYFPQDPRVRREVTALLEAGHEVDVLCLRRPGEPIRERRGPLRIRRIPVEHHRGGAAAYFLLYGAFLAAATALVGLLHLRRRYDVVQVNSIPDTLVFSALVPRLLGARVVLDLHECMPEFFMTKFGVDAGHRGVRLLGAAEQASIRFAHAALTCTDEQRQVFVARGARRPITVVLNASDEELFDPARYPAATRAPGDFTIVCHGTIELHYGQDTLVRAVALLKDAIPELRAEIYGEGTYREELSRLVEELGVSDRVRLSEGWVPYEELVPALASAAAGLVAMKRDPFRDLTHTNKMYDYIVLRTPTLMSRTRSVEAYFDEGSFAWFIADDPADLARAIRALHADRELGPRLARHAAQVAEPYRWRHQRRHYVDAIESVLPAPAATAVA